MNTPGARRALSLKQNTTPAPISGNPKVYVKPEHLATDEAQKDSGFPRVFTPAGPKRVLQPSQEPDEIVAPHSKASAPIQPDIRASRSDPHTIGKVFSRPATRAENPPKTSVFSQTNTSKVEQINHRPQGMRDTNNVQNGQSRQNGKGMDELVADDSENEQDDLESCENVTENSAPLNRFGKFSVMTPIIERTLEFTSSTKYSVTPGGKNEDRFAADLREEASETAEYLREGNRQGDDIRQVFVIVA